jgi:hypothetical protein
MGALTEIREKTLPRRRRIGIVLAAIETDTISHIEVVYCRKGEGRFDWKTFRDDCEGCAIVRTRM